MEAPQPNKNIQTPFNQNSITVRGAGNEDLPASVKNDTLGFKPYVEAVYSYLKNPLTKAPFTLSVEGEWGAGKSSFMYQLEETLKKDNQKTVRFNAWRHDKVESMWAAFALHFIKELMHELKFFPRIWANVELRWKRFDFSKGWFSIFKTSILFVFYVFLIVKLINYLQANEIGSLIESDKLNWAIIITALGSTGVILGALFIFSKLAEVTGNPFKTDLAKFVNTPNYAGNVAFIEEFHRDFDETINILTNNKSKIFVFIDDLDRADVPKAAELMQGLNMMISNSPRLIFIIGMDREKVAAGVAAKYKDLLPFINPHQGLLSTVSGLEQARDFGYRFLEKFIQLSFMIPTPSNIYMESFIDSLSGAITEKPNPDPIRYNPIFSVADGEDNRQFREVTLLLAPFFEDNPRRVKQFVNSFRLKAHIANSTGLFNEINGENLIIRNAVTIPQLGKFIALLILWPALIDLLSNDSNFLRNVIRRHSENEEVGDLTKIWKNNELFVTLLELAPNDREGSMKRDDVYNMKYLDVRLLLETSPLYLPGENQDKNTRPINQETQPNTAYSTNPVPPPNYEQQAPNNNYTGSGTTSTTTYTSNNDRRNDVQ